MKKVLSILLSVLLVILMFSGCAEESRPLRICIDMQTHGLMSDPSRDFYDVAGVLQSNGKIGEFEFDIIPGSGAERGAALDHIRTEMMSGGGPDVFLVSCTREDYVNSAPESLFPMPEKIMSTGMFLPLDEYIENAEYGEWETFPQSVLDAGRNEEGQLIIPLIYTLPAAVYLAEDVQFTFTKETTWENMLADETMYRLVAPLADGLCARYSDLGNAGGLAFDTNLNYILGDLADFEEEKLLFTEEELLQRVLEVRAIQEYAKETGIYNEGGWAYATEGWYEDYLGVKFDQCYLGNKNGVFPNDEVSILPICSDDGGVTATITAYAAVNRNTRKPEEAFKVIDRLLYFGMMQESQVYNRYLYTYGDQSGGIPMNTAVFCEPYDRSLGTNGIQTKNLFYLAPQKQDALFHVLDQITHVEFADALHKTLEDMMLHALGAPDDEACAEIVREYYSILKQIAAE